MYSLNYCVAQDPECEWNMYYSVIPSYSPEGDSFLEMMDNANIPYRIGDYIKKIEMLNTEGTWDGVWNTSNENWFR